MITLRQPIMMSMHKIIDISRILNNLLSRIFLFSVSLYLFCSNWMESSLRILMTSASLTFYCCFILDKLCSTEKESSKYLSSPMSSRSCSLNLSTPFLFLVLFITLNGLSLNRAYLSPRYFIRSIFSLCRRCIPMVSLRG